MKDQASKLRSIMTRDKGANSINNSSNVNSAEVTLIRPRAFREKTIKIYSIVSGKGGVGKTNFTINLAIQLAKMGKKVLILDADIGMCNDNILLGVQSQYNLLDFIQGKVKLEDVIVKGPEGVNLISGGNDLFQFSQLEEEKQRELIISLCDLGVYDIMLIDNGAGISKYSLTFTQLADEVILVTTPEPTAITDAYRMLKAVALYGVKDKAKVVINQVHEEYHGLNTFEKLSRTAEEFLSIKLENLGFIFNDIRVNRAIMEQIPILIRYPKALASKNIVQITNNLLGDKDYKFRVSTIKQFSNRIMKLFG